MPDPREIERTLSACGWKWDHNGLAWKKGEHGICVEALDDLLRLHPWAYETISSAICGGAVGFKITIKENSPGVWDPPHDMTVELVFEYETSPQLDGEEKP